MMNFDVTIIGGDGNDEKEENIQYLYCDFKSGLSQALGEYVIFLGLSDFNSQNRIAKQLALLQSSGADICFCGAVSEDGDDFDPNGLIGVIPPATVAVANLCLATAMFKTNFLRNRLGDEKISSINPYFWLNVMRDAKCIALKDKLVTVSSNEQYSFRELYGSEAQSKHHPLIKYYHEYEKLSSSGLYKVTRLPSKLSDMFFNR